MQDTEKVKVTGTLNQFCIRTGSQNKAASQLGVSAATLSQMLNGNWENIDDRMWNKVANSIGHTAKNWVIVETEPYLLAMETLYDIQNESLSKGMVANAGTCKTQAIKNFCHANRDAFRLKCSEYWNRKTFVEEMVRAMHLETSGRTVNQLMNYIVDSFKMLANPCVLFDEMDKLNDQTMHFYITMFNELEEHVGFGLIGTLKLQERIVNGADRGKKGYPEILSRIGGEFIQLPANSPIDIAKMCKANGVEDAKFIQEIIHAAKGDARIVKDRIYAHRRALKKAGGNN